MSGHLSQRELESHLWGAATLLRGLIDASDYKQYIFPLLFFKREPPPLFRRTPGLSHAAMGSRLAD